MRNIKLTNEEIAQCQTAVIFTVEWYTRTGFEHDPLVKQLKQLEKVLSNPKQHNREV